MKINKAELKKVNAMELTEAVELVNELGIGPKIKLKQPKEQLAEALVRKVLKLADAKHVIPEKSDDLVCRIHDPGEKPAEEEQKPIEMPDEVVPIEEVLEEKPPKAKKPAKAKKEKAAKPEPVIEVKVVEEKPAKVKLTKDGKPVFKINEDMTIHIVEGKEPKRPDTIAWKNFEQYKKYPIVRDFLKKSSVKGARACLAFDRYHGRIELR